jgi:glycosyltransferase involved in cell wall biosynthesis
LRVLIGMPDAESLGGPAACEPPFVAELRRQGVDVEEETYVYGDRPGGTPAAERVRRVVGASRRLRARLGAGGFDLLHLNTSFDTKALVRDLFTVTLLPRRAAKIFLKFHGSDAALLNTTNPLLRRAGRALLARADAVGVLSTEERDNFAAAGVPREKLFVVKNVVERADLTPREVGQGGVADDEAGVASGPGGFMPEADGGEGEGAGRVQTLNARLGVAEGVPVLLFIARLIPAKGLLDVIRACALLRERGQEFALACVGDGPARAEAEREAERLGLGGRVRFCGLVPERETAEFYRASTMLVFPTYHYEGFPMVVFYSLLAGLPVVTTRIRAAADYLTEPDNCHWVEPRDPSMLAEKIGLLLENTDARARMRSNNLRLAREFAAPAVTGEYVEVYRRVAGPKRSTAAG